MQQQIVLNRACGNKVCAHHDLAVGALQIAWSNKVIQKFLLEHQNKIEGIPITRKVLCFGDHLQDVCMLARAWNSGWTNELVFLQIWYLHKVLTYLLHQEIFEETSNQEDRRQVLLNLKVLRKKK